MCKGGAGSFCPCTKRGVALLAAVSRGKWSLVPWTCLGLGCYGCRHHLGVFVRLLSNFLSPTAWQGALLTSVRALSKLFPPGSANICEQQPSLSLGQRVWSVAPSVPRWLHQDQHLPWYSLCSTSSLLLPHWDIPPLRGTSSSQDVSASKANLLPELKTPEVSRSLGTF